MFNMTGVAIAEALVIVFLVFSFEKERSKLLDRLMAKDYNEYRHARQPSKKGGNAPNFIKESIDKQTRERYQDFE